MKKLFKWIADKNKAERKKHPAAHRIGRKQKHSSQKGNNKMLNCNSYLRDQLSKAYEAAKKVITSAEIEKEYIKMAKAGSQAARDTLFNLYIPFAISGARSHSYEMYSGEMGDLISAAAIGFNRAL